MFLAPGPSVITFIKDIQKSCALFLCYRSRSGLAASSGQWRLLAVGVWSFLSVWSRTSVPQQPCRRHIQLLLSPNWLSLLHPMWWQQEADLSSMWPHYLLQPETFELPLAAGRKVRTQCHYKTGQSPTPDMWAWQDTSPWLRPWRQHFQRPFVLWSLLQVHGRNKSEKQMSVGSTLQRPVWCLWRSLQSWLQPRSELRL
jgi:hypothetical protein